MLMLLNADINRQAAIIAYLDDCWLMMILTILALPLVLLLRRPVQKAVANPNPH